MGVKNFSKNLMGINFQRGNFRNPSEFRLSFPEKKGNWTLVHWNPSESLCPKFFPFSFHQGQISAQGILHLRNPNSGKQILDAPEFWTQILANGSIFRILFLSSKRGPQNKFTLTHLPKFTFQSSTQKSGKHFTSHLCRAVGLTTHPLGRLDNPEGQRRTKDWARIFYPLRQAISPRDIGKLTISRGFAWKWPFSLP